MIPADPRVAGIGRLPGTEGACVCVVGEGPGHAVAFLAPDGSLVVADPTPPRELLAAVIAWFEGSLADPPPALEATHEDVAAVVRALAGTTVSPVRELLAEAVDAIDDGLAEDVVVRRLAAAAMALDPDADEQVDWVDLLVERYRSIRGA